MHVYGYVIVLIYVGLCLLSSVPLILGARKEQLIETLLLLKTDLGICSQ